MLETSSMPLVEVALTVGFAAQSHFTTVFKRFVGETPACWRRSRRTEGGAGSDSGVMALGPAAMRQMANDTPPGLTGPLAPAGSRWASLESGHGRR
jgi:AraC-like DNA-binding protein